MSWPFPPLSRTVLAWMGVASVVMFVGSLLAVPWLLARLPADYFIHDRPRRDGGNRRWWWWLIGHLVKNVIGAILVLMGVAMLVLPGQGLLTILIGLSLLDFPGKRACELNLIRRPHVLRAVNWLRRKSGRPPLIVERPSASSPPPEDAE